MKTILLNVAIFLTLSLQAQTFFTEDFNALIVGNLNGQGGWTSSTNVGTFVASDDQIYDFGGTHQKVLKMKSPATNDRVFVTSKPVAWATVTTGNKYFTCEFDLYTGAVSTGAGLFSLLIADASGNITNGGFTYDAHTQILTGSVLRNLNDFPTLTKIPLGANDQDIVLQPNTWYRIGFTYGTSLGGVTWKEQSGLFNKSVLTDFDVTAVSTLEWYRAPDITNPSAVEFIVDNITARASSAIDVLSTETIQSPRNHFSVYPNPVRDVLSIGSSSKVNSTEAKVSVVDMQGRLVKEMNFTENIDLSSLSSGAYVVRIADKSGSETIKIIKK